MYTLNSVNPYKNAVIDNSDNKTDEEKQKQQIKKAADEGRATDRGTKIVKQGGDLDKNAFLRILAAQMRNQDPTGQNSDPSAYVAQLAQFATMEQMQNLNKSATTLAGTSMIGKGVSLKYGDANGNPITGIVRLSEEQNGEIVLGIEVYDEKGNAQIMPVNMSDVATIIDNPDYNMDNINVNTALMQATSMIGKNVVLEIPDEEEKPEEGGETGGTEETNKTEETEDPKDPEKPEEPKPPITVKGKVVSVVKESGGIFINVKLESGEIKKYPYNSVVKIEE